YDVIFDGNSPGYASHAITTVFHMMVNDNEVRLDNQSSNYAWKSAHDWLKEIKHEFLLSALKLLVSCSCKTVLKKNDSK
ncbi:hypothetical protein HQ585_19465, partial [candidate division KSB1 bacterium]|nr:hypothetical protein [candidate division KSB1 bacterium]